MLTREPVVQIHPSRLCNYQCLHCYSSSGPKLSATLDVQDILRTTGELAARGYTRAALSGGEPVLYPDFALLVRGLSEQGFSVSVITNGSRPAPLLAACDANHVHHAAVSFDGRAELHDKIRKKAGAFEAAISTMNALRTNGYSRGAVLSVTQHSMPQLPDMIDEVVQAGAKLIQLHPLAAVGRAAQNASHVGEELQTEALVRLFMLSKVLRHRHPDIAFQCDVISSAQLSQQPIEKGSLISPLVLRDDGTIVPFSYDFSKDHSLGRIGEDVFETSIQNELVRLLKNTTQRLADSVVTSFYGELVADSHTSSFCG